MIQRPTAAAELPPPGITGLDPAWSRLVTAPTIDGTDRTWHLLDTWASQPDGGAPELTLLCVHGNPSWSFLWRDLLAQVERAEPDRVRVIAVDQLDMGFSERTGMKRTLATRVDDLCRLTGALGLRGPVITVAHDWGGPISLGWALRHLETRQGAGRDDGVEASGAAKLVGVVLTNTAVHQPAASPAPALIRLARTRLMLRPATVHTAAFIQGAIEMSRPKLTPEVRAGFHAPYRDRSRRSAIADFVADIPLDPSHESAAALDAIATGLADLDEIPALLLWGPRDRVFGDLYLHDLEARLPHADVHRYPGAAHFVAEDADVGGAVLAWLHQFVAASGTGSSGNASETKAGTNASSACNARALADFSSARPDTDAVVEIAPAHRAISFGELTRRTGQLAAGMSAFGIRPGDRVAVMITPGVELALAVYGCWRLGATLVLVDSGLGRTGMQAALRSANPGYLIGIDKALVAARALRWPGRRIAVAARSAALKRALNITTDLDTLTRQGDGHELPPFPTPDTVACIAFTSGSTGPSKGVIYRHGQIQAQRDALMALYRITTADRLVAAFAPFALYGPTMGITSIVPDMDVTAPGTLTAQALLDAVERVDATLVFASPAALVNVMATHTASAASTDSAVRLVLSAGAPVRAELLKAASALFGAADFHTPYGMTEMLPVADISLAELVETGHTGRGDDRGAGAEGGDGPAGSGSGGGGGGGGGGDYEGGVCVGHPLPNVDIFIDPLDRHGKASGRPGDSLQSETDVLGEIVVRASHAREGYDRLWLTDHRASQPAGWHRTGDVGQLDAAGRLWVGGRLGHVITTPAGPMAPVCNEQRIEQLDEVVMAALVGVGPVGTQSVVAVVQIAASDHRGAEASLELHDRIRGVVTDQTDVVAALVVERLPVDRRHNSKVDRAAVAAWAARLLAGERVASL